MTRISRLLVANRGEIARRIFRTCREMGIDTVAVYAEPDANAPFVHEAGQAVALGGSTSAETYLDMAKLLDAARRSGADAVHPGYGFLSENAGFARAVIEAGLTWVGPHPQAIGAMGDKLAAKRIMAEAGVPMLIGVALDPDMTEAELLDHAAAVGYPVLVKASGGGGGRGMRIVREAGGLKAAVASARREAKSAFGNDAVFLERYLEGSRHIEVQVFGDKHRNVAHLFERECSIQRRHQKIIEEAPSSAVSPELRERMGASAVAAAHRIGYDNAGTVEFLLDSAGEFFFLEMNTRLQVEHPVTESITGLDLVREQIRVAEGHPLSFSQDDLRIDGHSIEVRLYAENPAKEFFPVAGHVLAFERPAEPAVRWDSGVETGSDVSVFFDPMLAKVIAHAPTRDEAALKLALALERLRIPGLVTNRDFLVNVLRGDAFLAGDTTTDFIDRIATARTKEAAPEDIRFAAVAAALAGQYERRLAAPVLQTVGPGWRNNPSAYQKVSFDGPGGVIDIEYRAASGEAFEVRAGGEPGHCRVVRCDGGVLGIELDRVRRSVSVLHDGDNWHTHDGRIELTLTERPRFPAPRTAGGAGGYEAPMPGKVVSVHVAPGDAVKDGQLLLVLEAMKMEHHITCSRAGTVASVRVAAGQQVEGGAILVVITTEGS